MPELNDLPTPPAAEIGWPWTEDSPSLPDSMPDRRPWPSISIVTPSFNQAEFLEETIRSVLLQGLSKPGVHHHRRRQYRWQRGHHSPLRAVAELLGERAETEDRLTRSTRAGGDLSGEIVTWINSDDTYCAGAVRNGDRIPGGTSTSRPDLWRLQLRWPRW